MLSTDPAVEEILRWFAACYDVAWSPAGSPYWQRTALPRTGGIGNQDARVIFGMEYVAGLRMQLVDDTARQKARDQQHER